MIFFSFSDSKKEIPLSELSKEGVFAGCASVYELEKIKDTIGLSSRAFRLICEFETSHKCSVEIFEDCTVCMLKSADLYKKSEKQNCFSLIIKNNLILLVPVRDDDDDIYSRFLKALDTFAPKSVTAEKLIFAFLGRLTDGYSSTIEEAGIRISKLEEYVIKDMAGKDFNLNLHYMKKEILLLMNYLEQLRGVAQSLEENSNEILSGDLRYLSFFREKIKGLCDSVKTLLSTLNQLSDAFDSSLNYKLNNTMKLFTVISAVFYPLTLITSWYGMNFKNMPELNSRFGYPFVAVLCLFIAIVLFAFFKRKKWL